MKQPPKKRGPKPGTGGRPIGSGEINKVKLTCWVTPETRAKLGDRPGAEIDRLYSDRNKTKPTKAKLVMDALRDQGPAGKALAEVFVGKNNLPEE